MSKTTLNILLDIPFVFYEISKFFKNPDNKYKRTPIFGNPFFATPLGMSLLIC